MVGGGVGVAHPRREAARVLCGGDESRTRLRSLTNIFAKPLVRGLAATGKSLVWVMCASGRT